MVYEIIVNEMPPEQRDAYIKAYRETWLKVDRPGCHGVRILKCIERDNRVITQIAWDSVEAHEKAREIPGHSLIRDLRNQFDVSSEGYSHYTYEDF